MTGAQIAILVVLLLIIAVQIAAVVYLLVSRYKRHAAAATEAKPAKQYKHPALVSAVKAVAVLVCICFVCVALLAVCNEFLYIDDAERFARAMRDVYSDYSPAEGFEADLTHTSAPTGNVKNVYKSKDGVYIIEAVGNDGYQGGTVTLYVLINPDATIKSWAIKENTLQSYIARVPSNAGTRWYVGKRVDEEFGKDMTGATVIKTTDAIYNAVKAAAWYCLNTESVKNELGLIDKEGLARDAVKQLLGDDYASATFAAVNVSTATVDGTEKVADALSDETDKLSYLFRVTNDGDVLFAYVYGEETLKVVVVKDGEILSKSEGIEDTDAIVVKILANRIYTFTFGSYNAYAIMTSSTEGVYTVAGLGIGTTPQTYVLEVTVVADTDGKGKVQAINTVVDGYVPGQPTKDETDRMLTYLVGARLDNIDELYNTNLDNITGATHSANLIRVAVQAALTAFDANAASGN